MTIGYRNKIAGLAVAALLLPGMAIAQDAKPKPSNPVGGAQQQASTQADAQAGMTLDAKQLEAVKLVTAYFNDAQTLKGTFTQTNSEKQRLRGKFYVKRPGKLRFDYNPPSLQYIVADGDKLQIADRDLGTDDRLALDQTPFRMLVRKDVDLLRDARILELQEADDLVIMSIQDKSPDAPGRIRLFFSKAPKLELKEWVTTDQQGKDTRVEVTNIVKNEDVDAALFVIRAPEKKVPGQ